ncbi:MAG: chemotaxis protein CheD [Magnetococcales bacterium]|nr:chemotaxis protein CheD [Magnetococcales bacterium]
MSVSNNALKAPIKHFLLPGEIFVKDRESVITTVLGSCIAVCIWDQYLHKGGMNHFKLPFWNGEGIPSPKYGNIAITALVEAMVAMGCQQTNLKAKVFGGGAVLQSGDGMLNVGERNIQVAYEILEQIKVPIVAVNVGGDLSRKIIFNTNDGSVMMKKAKASS